MTAVHPDKASLQVHLPHDYDFVKPPTDAAITIPSSQSWGSIYLMPVHIDTFKVSATALLPLLYQPWSTLTMRISLPQAGKDQAEDTYKRRVQATQMHISVLGHLWSSRPREPWSPLRINRLILILEECQHSKELGIFQVNTLLDFGQRNLRKVQRAPADHVYRTWTMKRQHNERVSWEVGFHLNEWAVEEKDATEY